MASDDENCSFSSSTSSDCALGLGLLLGAVIVLGGVILFIFLNIIWWGIKACRERRRRRPDTLPNFELNARVNTSGTSPDNPRTPQGNLVTIKYSIPFMTRETTISGHMSSDMDRNIKSGIAQSSDLQDLEAAIPRHHTH